MNPFLDTEPRRKLVRLERSVSLPPVVLRLLDECNGYGFVAGGAVVRDLIGAKASDIDFFVTSEDTYSYAITELRLAGYSIKLEQDKNGEREYDPNHYRTILESDGERDIDVVFDSRWHHIEDVLESFDLDICRMAYLGEGYVLMLPEAREALLTRTVQVRRMTPPTPARLQKYKSIGFTHNQPASETPIWEAA